MIQGPTPAAGVDAQHSLTGTLHPEFSPETAEICPRPVPGLLGVIPGWQDPRKRTFLSSAPSLSLLSLSVCAARAFGHSSAMEHVWGAGNSSFCGHEGSRAVTALLQAAHLQSEGAHGSFLFPRMLKVNEFPRQWQASRISLIEGLFLQHSQRLLVLQCGSRV